MSRAVRFFTALVIAMAVLAACCGPSRPTLSLVSYASYELRVHSNTKESDAREGAAIWTDTGLVTFTWGPSWAGDPMATAKPGECTNVILIGWVGTDDASLAQLEPGKVAYAIESCALKRVALVRGRVKDVPRTIAHELGHAMGLEHVADGIMFSREDGAGEITCDDVDEFCRVHACNPVTVGCSRSSEVA